MTLSAHLRPELLSLTRKLEIDCSPFEDVEGLLQHILDYYDMGDEDQIQVFRKELRLHLLDLSLHSDDPKTLYQMTFSGEGDSGNYHNDAGNKLVDDFLILLGEEHIQFDWYNGDGGGGNITWDLTTDKITINGYENVTEAVDVMVDVEV